VESIGVARELAEKLAGFVPFAEEKVASDEGSGAIGAEVQPEASPNIVRNLMGVFDAMTPLAVSVPAVPQSFTSYYASAKPKGPDEVQSLREHVRSEEFHSQIAKLFCTQLMVTTSALLRQRVSKSTLECAVTKVEEILDLEVEIAGEPHASGFLSQTEMWGFDEMWYQVSQLMNRVETMLNPSNRPYEGADCPLFRLLVEIGWVFDPSKITIKNLFKCLAIILDVPEVKLMQQHTEAVDDLCELLNKYSCTPHEGPWSRTLSLDLADEEWVHPFGLRYLSVLENYVVDELHAFASLVGIREAQ